MLIKIMKRIIAVDYGLKRTGLAVSDVMQLIANGLDTVASNEVENRLQQYTAKEDVERIIVGMPRQLNGKPSDNMHRVEKFVKRLRNLIPDVPVEYFDERFTSLMAHRAMLDGGLKKHRRQDKALVDKISAVIILQDYLEQKRNINT
jgi:putative Holliday junction resolvase